MKIHKRPKNSRIRGARTCGWGFRQQHKGHGNKGGVGMAGSHAHKRQSTEAAVKKGTYFGKKGATSRGTVIEKYEKINLCDIKNNFFKKDGDKIDFSKHKILGKGNGFKAEIKALAATASAIEKMEKAGGKIILPAVKDDVKQYVKKAKAEEESDASEDEE